MKNRPLVTLFGLVAALAACSRSETPAPSAEAPAAGGGSTATLEPAAEAKPPEPAPAPEPAPEAPAALAQQAPPAVKNCGGDDQPLCALGQWMDDNTRVAAEEGDLEKLAAAFHTIEFMAPDPSWNEGENAWNRISRIGAVKAEEGDLRAARKQCKACHDQWRDQYEERFWHLPVPSLPPNAERGDPDLTL